MSTIVPEPVPRAHPADYAVFLSLLILTAVFCVLTGYRARRRTEQERVTAKKYAKWPLVALNVLAAFMTAPFVLGTPAEVYYHGIMFFMIVIGFILATPIITHFFLPYFHRLRLQYAYQYFERRWNKDVRLAATLVFIVQIILFLGMVIHAPALAISTVVNAPIQVTTISVGLVCTIFATVGELKAVKWVDLFCVIVCVVMLSVLSAYGSVEAGGMDRVWQLAQKHGRLTFYDFNIDPDPLTRHTLLSQIVGGLGLTLVTLVVNQMTVHRLLIQDLRDGQKAMYLATALFAVVMSLMALTGLVMFGYYYGCDPAASDRTAPGDKMLMVFMADLTQHLPGLMGFFMSAIFGLSRNHIVAGLGAIAAMMMNEFVIPSRKRTTAAVNRRTEKIITFVFGLISVAAAYLRGTIKKPILQLSLSIYGACAGPILGMMLMGMFLPFTNSWGTFSGLFVGLATTWAIMIGGFQPDLRPRPLPLTVHNCTWSDPPNATLSMETTYPTTDDYYTFPTEDMGVIEHSNPSEYDGPAIFKLSYMYYSIFGALMCMLVGIIVSLLTSCICPSTRVRDLKMETVVCDCGCCFYCTDNDVSYAMDETSSEPEKSEVSLTEAGELPPKVPIYSIQTANGYATDTAGDVIKMDNSAPNGNSKSDDVIAKEIIVDEKCNADSSSQL